MPPQRMAPATSSGSASATCSQLGNLSLSCANALSELTSEVCCDRTVAMISSMIGSTGLGTDAPWLARRRRCTAVISAGLGPVPGKPAPSVLVLMFRASSRVFDRRAGPARGRQRLLSGRECEFAAPLWAPRARRLLTRWFGFRGQLDSVCGGVGGQLGQGLDRCRGWLDLMAV